MNFTRPVCKNLGIRLPSYVYRTPKHQISKNKEGNKVYDSYVRLGLSQVSQVFGVNETTFERCWQLLVLFYCREHFPSCDRTESVVKEQMMCRESCLHFTHVCSKIYKKFLTYYTIHFPEKKKKYECKLQPYRNAGDSPECWYFNQLNNLTGRILSCFITRFIRAIFVWHFFITNAKN